MKLGAMMSLPSKMRVTATSSVNQASRTLRNIWVTQASLNWVTRVRPAPMRHGF